MMLVFLTVQGGLTRRRTLSLYVDETEGLVLQTPCIDKYS